MKTLRFLGSLLILAGACLWGRSLYLQGKAALASILIRKAWDETIRTGEERRPWPWADTHPVARLRIPALGYDEIVLEGASPRNLAFGPARLMNSAAPGEPGNLVLAGHRTSWFRRLADVQIGNEMIVESRRRRRSELSRRTYRVASIRIVSPDDVSYLGATPEDALTLVTCYPFGPWPGSPQRYIVRAIPSDL